MNAMEQILNMLYVGLLWLVFSVPVITAGAASSAAYYTMTKVVRGHRSYVFREFWSSFRSDFKQSTLLWLIWLVTALVIGLDMNIIKGLQQGAGASAAAGAGTGSGLSAAFQIILAIVMAIISVLTVYALSYASRFSQKTGVIIRNSLLMSVRHLPSSLLILAVLAASAALLYCFGLFIVIVPGVDIMLFSVILEKVFYLYMSDEDRRLEDIRNNPGKYDQSPGE